MLSPDDPLPYYHLGNAYYMMAMYEDAIDSYKHSLALDDENGQLHFNIGSAYSALEQFETAEKHYNLSIKYKKSNLPSYLCLGEVQIELGNYE